MHLHSLTGRDRIGPRRAAFGMALLLVLAVAPGARAQLLITPTFDSSITSDPNAAAIEGVINSAIHTYETTFNNPIQVNITFKEMTSGLGQSNFSLFSVPYSAVYAALAGNSSMSSDDVTALAHLPNQANNPVTGTANMLLKSANIKALGITGVGLPSSDGTIGLNTHITDVGSPGTSGQFSLLATAEHEIDEILGLGSTLGLGLGSPFNNDPSMEDLFRYDQNGNRSFTMNSSAQAFFSLDGTTRLAQFDNQNDGGDFGDWQSNPLPPGVKPQVQDAFAIAGAAPALGVELRALDAIGYNLTTAASPVPEPSSLSLLAAGALALAGYGWRRRKASA